VGAAGVEMRLHDGPCRAGVFRQRKLLVGRRVAVHFADSHKHRFCQFH
jgi:hypothetical protein